MPHRLTPGRLWLLFRNDVERGWRAAWHDYFTTHRIRRWKPRPDLPSMDVSVHVVTGENDYRYAAWMLASWSHFTERDWPVYIHDDGSLPPEAARFYEALLPRVTIIPRTQANKEVDAALAPFPLCIQCRNRHNLGLKLYDPRHYAPGERYILLDSDLIFYRRPDLLLDWADDPADGRFFFMEDVQDASALPHDEVREKLGFELLEKVNSGLCLLSKELMDLDFMEDCLRKTGLLQTTRWTFEQTLFALCASRHGKGGLLPPEYHLTLGTAAREDAVVRHYVGKVRQQIYSEGIRRLAPILLTAKR